MSKIDLEKAHTGTLKMLILATPEPPRVTLNVIQNPHHFLVYHATLYSYSYL